jgi:hypothetical protein
MISHNRRQLNRQQTLVTEMWAVPRNPYEVDSFFAA